MPAGVHIVLPSGLSRTLFAGRPLGDHLSAVASEAGLKTVRRPGPLVTVDGLFAAVSADSLRGLADTLSSRGGILRTSDGRVVATARREADPAADPRKLLANPDGAHLVVPDDEAVRVEDAWALALTEKAVVQRWLRALARKGVRLVDPARIHMEYSVVVHPGATLWPDVVLRGDTVIHRGAEVRSGCWIDDTEVGERSLVKPNSVCEGAFIGPDCAIGPMAHLRRGTELLDDVKVGNFVEVKNAVLRSGVRASHLSYLGDADIGEATNVGAGTITCNYDGFGKHRTQIGEGAFIGSNTALVAPITVGDGAIVGAGSTVTRNVPADALYLGRANDRIYDGKAPSIRSRARAKAERAKDEG
jgi:NDP-sugar pyrophosphorylase family protein